MPAVDIVAKGYWYPDPLESPLHPRFVKITLDIGRAMPSILVKVFRDVFEEDLKPEEVVYDFRALHPQASTNQPDISIIVSPALTERRSDGKGMLCASIMAEVKAFIVEVLNIKEGSPAYPSIDYMVKFVIESGRSVNTKGETTSTW